MALITSATDITVIILDNIEAKALGDMLSKHPTLNEDYPILDELTNALITEDMAFAYEDNENDEDADPTGEDYFVGEAYLTAVQEVKNNEMATWLGVKR